MLVYGTLVTIIVFFIVILLRTNIFRQMNSKDKLLIIFIICTAVFLRVYKYDTAMGLNLDEAQSGYNAFALANYSVDDHLLINPVYLTSWGSGMSVLYALTSIPWIKLFGLSVASCRFSMVLLSSLSLILMIYVFLKVHKKFKRNLIFLIVLYFSPWMIMSNRWGLDCNLFQVIFCFFVSSFLLYNHYIDNDKKRLLWFLTWNLLIAISAYAYAANWIFLAVFVVLLYAYLFKNKLIKLKEVFIGIIEQFIIILPLLIYVLVNFIPLKTIHFLGLTIPRMEFNRSDSQMIFSQDGSIVHNIIHNITKTFNVLANGDTLIWNNLPFYGVMYSGFVFIMIIGLIIIIMSKNKTVLDNLMLIMFIANIPNILFMIPNTNHMNAMILPVFYFTACGIVCLFDTKQLMIIASLIYIFLCLGFCNAYFNQYKSELSTNGVNLQPVELAKAIDIAKKYNHINVVNPNTTALYTITRFYDPISPYKWYKQKDFPVNSLVGTDYMKYGKYNFYNEINSEVIDDKSAVLLIFDGMDRSQINKKDYNIKKYNKYDLYIPKIDKD